METFRIDEATEEEKAATLNSFFETQRKVNKERKAAVEVAIPALERICEAMRMKTGQSYHLRSLLYSLWNGQSAPVNAVLDLDWELRKDFCAVLLAFGFEYGATSFFYDAMTAQLKKARLFEWFLEAHESGVAA
jgi:hypothetical protein